MRAGIVFTLVVVLVLPFVSSWSFFGFGGEKTKAMEEKVVDGMQVPPPPHALAGASNPNAHPDNVGVKIIDGGFEGALPGPGVRGGVKSASHQREAVPEAVGLRGEDALMLVKSKHPEKKVVLVNEGDFVTMDMREDRIRVWVSEDGTVKKVPRVG